MLISVGQTRSGGSNTPRSHLREPATSTNMHRDFIVFHDIFHILMTYVFRVIQNTKSGNGSIEHLGKTFLDAAGGDPVIGHLTKENKEWSGFS
jgi:hypothetical protein